MLKAHTSLTSGVLAVLVASSLSGCASAPSDWLAEDSPRPTPVRTAQTPAKPTPSSNQSASNTTSNPHNIAFTAPQTSPSAPPPEPANMIMIGLYGEVSGSNSKSGTPYDGDSNLAQVSFATEGACIDPDVDRTGTWLVFASTMHRKTSDIYIKAVKGKTQTQITTDPADDAMPCFSPDGKHIAFASNRAGNWDVYVSPVGEGGRSIQITNDAEHELHPSWSPDGRTITYCKFGSQSQRWEIWVVDANNPGVRHFLDYGVFPQWCPDPTKSKILFQRAKQRGSRYYSVWTIDYINGQAMHPTEIVSAANAALINPSWSPEGNRIVFVAVVDPDKTPEGRPNQSDVWVVNIDGSNRTNLTNGQFANFQPMWAGQNVYFVSDRSGVDNVWSVNTSTMLPPRGTSGEYVSAESPSRPINTPSHP